MADQADLTQRRTRRTSTIAAMSLAMIAAVSTGCAAHPPEPVAPSAVTSVAPEPPPVVPDEQIIHPDAWTLLPGEMPVQSWSGSHPTIVELPAHQVGFVYVMYATCSGSANMILETSGATSEGNATWQVDCDSVPNRRETHTDDATRAMTMRLIVEGEGSWGLVLANTEDP